MLQKVFEMQLFWGQKVKGQRHMSKNVPVWVFALLWVLASSIGIPGDIVG